MFQQDLEKRLSLGRQIESERMQRGWSRAFLANKAGYDERTVRNAVNGQRVKEQTIFDICNALEISIENFLVGQSSIGSEVAPVECGAYSKAVAAKYEGIYTAYRRGFSKKPVIFRSIYEFRWNEQLSGLVFFENQKYVGSEEEIKHNSQDGKIYMSDFTGLVHLLTIQEGSVRLLTLTKLKNNEMKGSVLTQSERTMFFQPSVSAITFRKVPPEQNYESLSAGTVDPQTEEYEQVHGDLAQIEEDVIFISSLQSAF